MQFVRLLHSLQGVSADKLPGGMLLVDHLGNFVVNEKEEFIEATIPAPDPPTERYFHLTNTGVGTLYLTVNSCTSGNIFIDDTFIMNFGTSMFTIEVEPMSEVKITGATPRNMVNRPLLSAQTGSFSLDRFDESINDYSYAFTGCNALTEITSWNNVSNCTDFSHAFERTGLVSIPASWNGLGSTVNTSYMFADCTNLTTGGTTAFGALDNVTNMDSMLSGCTSWTGNSKDMYDYMKTKVTPVTSHSDAFGRCTSSIGYNRIPESWGGGMVLPTHYLQFTNFGSNLCKIAVYSTTSGTAYLDDDFAAEVTASTTTATVIEIPAGSVLKLSGLTPKHDVNRPMFADVSGYTGRLSLDRFDDLIQDYEFAFSSWVVPFTSLKKISSWDGASGITAFRDSFNSSGLITIPSSWVGLDNLTTMWGTFNGCASIIAIPDSWDGLNNVTSLYCAFSDLSGLQTGGSTGFDALSKVNNMWYAFRGCTQWTGNAKAMYDYLSTKSITVTDHTNTFLNCTNTVGYYQIPSSWGGGA